MTSQRHQDDDRGDARDRTRDAARAEYSELDPDTITEDAIDTFEQRSDTDSPASEASADAPG